jgi:F0F1-type ATP synthase assembly protein I
MALCIVAGVVAGVWLDRRVGASGFLLIASILLGIAAGVYGVYRILAREIK